MEHDHFEEVNIGKPLKKGPLPILMLIYRIYAQWQRKMCSLWILVTRIGGLDAVELYHFHTRWCPRSYKWVIIPLTIDISPINHSYWTV
jgi:hypothetical protein